MAAATDTPLLDATDLHEPVVFNPDAYGGYGLVSAYRHADGSISYIVYDDSGASPRDDEGNIATLIGDHNSYHVDDDTARLAEAHDRFTSIDLMRRYLAMFRPDIIYYTDQWWAGSNCAGWGYILRETWERHMYPDRPAGTDPDSMLEWLDYTPPLSPEESFDQEVALYGMWLEGEEFGTHYVGAHHVTPDGTDDSRWGFLGYEDHQQIAMELTSSPIVKELW